MAYLDGDAHHGLADASGIAAMTSLAERAGFESLSALLREVTGASAQLAVPDVLVTHEVDSISVPTRSSRRRLHIALQDSKVGHAIAAKVPGAREFASYIRQRLA
jgi:DNA-binding IclR family transcriptional regulator